MESRSSDKPESTPAVTGEVAHTETPTILEEANSEVSLQTTQETSEVVSIESSSEFLSDAQKIESPSPESMVHESQKKDAVEETSSQENIDNSTVKVTEESNHSPSAEVVVEEESNKKREFESNESISKNEDEKSEKNEIGSPEKEMMNGFSDKSEASEIIEVVPKENSTEVVTETPVYDDEDKPVTVDNIECAIVENAKETSEVVEVKETVVSETVEVVEEENQTNDIKANEAEQTEIPEKKVTEEAQPVSVDASDNQENQKEEKQLEEISDAPQEAASITAVSVDEEKQSTEEEVKSQNGSTSPSKIIEVTKSDSEKLEKEDIVTNSPIMNGECAIEEERDEKISTVINDNNGEIITERDKKEPSIISSTISDKVEEEVTAEPVLKSADEAVDVNSSDVYKNSEDIQNSVDSATQVPNAKEQIPTISTVCEAADAAAAAVQNLPTDSVVPQSVNGVNKVAAKDNLLANNVGYDNALVTDPALRRRSSLPNVSTENLDEDGNESDSASTSQRKSSSPQKRPRSASTSTQVEINHFGKNCFY